MENSQVYVGLDIGTTLIKVLVCENVKGQLKVVGIGVQPSAGLNRGVIVDIDKTAQAISRAVAEAAAKSGIDIKKVVVALPANYLQMGHVHGMITIASQGQSREIVNQDVIDVAQSTLTQNLPPEREIIDLVPQEFTVDGFKGIKDPRGMVGVRLELAATLYTGPKTIVHNTKKAVEQAGLQIQDLVVSPIATGFNLLNDGEQDFGTLVVDMGGGQTTASIIHDHQLKFVYVDPEGGQLVTRDISTVLNTSMRNAERLKRDHGYADSRMADENVQLAVDVVGQNQPVEYSEKYLAEIIEARIRQIFQRISNRLKEVHAPNLPGGVILLGGVTALPGVVELAKEYFTTNVKTFVPEQMGVRHPGFALAIALGMYEDHLNDIDRLLKQTVQQGALIMSPHQAEQPRKLETTRSYYQESYQKPMPDASSEPQQAKEEPMTPEKPVKKPKSKGGIKRFLENFFD